MSEGRLGKAEAGILCELTDLVQEDREEVGCSPKRIHHCYVQHVGDVGEYLDIGDGAAVGPWNGLDALVLLSFHAISNVQGANSLFPV